MVLVSVMKTYFFHVNPPQGVNDSKFSAVQIFFFAKKLLLKHFVTISIGI